MVVDEKTVKQWTMGEISETGEEEWDGGGGVPESWTWRDTFGEGRKVGKKKGRKEDTIMVIKRRIQKFWLEKTNALMAE